MPKIQIAPEINRIIRLLCDRKGFAQIARETGVSATWLQKLSIGAITDPSYTKIKILLRYFNI